MGTTWENTMSRRRNSHGGVFSVRPGDGGKSSSPVYNRDTCTTPVRTQLMAEQEEQERRRREKEEDASARALGFKNAADKRRQEADESARALGFDDASHKQRIIAAVQTVCTRNEVERMDKQGLSHVTLTVENVDGGKVEVTVSDEARVADVLAVACTKLSTPVPRSTLSFGEKQLDKCMAEKLTDMDIETDVVLRLVQLCDGQVNEAALRVITETARARPYGPTGCVCAIM